MGKLSLFCLGFAVVPEGVANQKFSGKGLVLVSALAGRVKDKKSAETLAHMANVGLAGRTWATYGSAVNNLRRCQAETSVDMSLPFTPNKVLEFIAWMKARKLKSRTMSSYLSGVRMFHIASGFSEGVLREPIIKLVLKGQANIEKIEKLISGKKGKLPVTIKVMKLLKLRLGKVDWPMWEVRLAWAVMTAAWSGSTRIHELLSRKTDVYDPQTTLLWKDVKFVKVKVEETELETMVIHIKSPKIDRLGAGDDVVISELGNFMCPLRAMKNYREVSKLEEDPNLPVFRVKSGGCFTGADFNKQLKKLLGDLDSKIPGGVVTSHSFRAGVASEMAKRGHSEEELMAVGRWSSEAYKLYMGLPLTHRATFARKIALE